mgnify:CR=1 FL=1|tara:strand:- start:734 stop:922 length:189 start_codon:yes stop_codon:yes gene_type:complete
MSIYTKVAHDPYVKHINMNRDTSNHLDKHVDKDAVDDIFNALRITPVITSSELYDIYHQNLT